MNATNNEGFDLASYLRDFGRLNTGEPGPRKRVTIKPGFPPVGERAYNEAARTIYPEALIDQTYPTAIPSEVLPVIVGPAFKWRNAPLGSRLAALIRDSDLDFIADFKDEDTASWAALHAAYLINEIDPDATISIWPKPYEPANAPRHPASRMPARQRLGTLGNRPPFSDTADFYGYPDYSGVSLRGGRETPDRIVTAKAWLDEQAPLDRAHWSFITNFRILGVRLFARFCTPADNADEILSAVRPEISKHIRRELLNGSSNPELAHPAVLQRFVELIESTEAQRMVLFDQLVSARKREDFRPTLGDTFICGTSFGTDLAGIRRARFPLEMLGVLIGAGAARVDFERRIIEPTPAGREVQAILSKCADIREYQAVIIDSLIGRQNEDQLAELEGWIIRYFETLKQELEKLDA